MHSGNNYPIDFVIAWVDGNDPEWKKEYYKYKGIEGDQRIARFRDMGTLKYLFRGIEKFTPWVNKVYFVTCDQRPDWLNVSHPKLVCVNHREYIPEKYLPTFSSHTIELNFHRIEGLSENFVYFNDDMFVVRPASREDFFKDGLPCDAAVMNYAATFDNPPFLVPYANITVINRNFSKSKVLKEHARQFFNTKYHSYLFRNAQFIPGSWFPGFKYFHIPTSLMKSTFQEVWDKEYEVLDTTCMHKFRVLSDVNQWLMQNWQFCKGDFVPRDTNIGYRGTLNTKENVLITVDKIVNGKHKLICANDDRIEDFDFLKWKLCEAFEQVLPEKSEFEM